jgi:hypothetical protein
MMVSLVVSAALAAVGSWSTGLFPGWELLLQVLNAAVSLGILTLLFAMIFKFMPSAPIAWPDVWIGAAVTAVLFEAGKVLIGLYLGKSGVNESVRGGRLAGGAAGLGVLRGADIPARRGVHEGLCQRPRVGRRGQGPGGHRGRCSRAGRRRARRRSPGAAPDAQALPIMRSSRSSSCCASMGLVMCA